MFTFQIRRNAALPQIHTSPPTHLLYTHTHTEVSTCFNHTTLTFQIGNCCVRTHVSQIDNTLLIVPRFALALTNTSARSLASEIIPATWKFYSNEPRSLLPQFHHRLIWDFTASNFIKAGQTCSLPVSLALYGAKTERAHVPGSERVCCLNELRSNGIILCFFHSE